MPAELFPQYTTIEYDTQSPNENAQAGSSNVFLFVVDTCVIEEELGFLKSALLQVRIDVVAYLVLGAFCLYLIIGLNNVIGYIIKLPK